MQCIVHDKSDKECLLSREDSYNTVYNLIDSLLSGNKVTSKPLFKLLADVLFCDLVEICSGEDVSNGLFELVIGWLSTSTKRTTHWTAGSNGHVEVVGNRP